MSHLLNSNNTSAVNSATAATSQEWWLERSSSPEIALLSSASWNISLYCMILIDIVSNLPRTRRGPPCSSYYSLQLWSPHHSIQWKCLTCSKVASMRHVVHRPSFHCKFSAIKRGMVDFLSGWRNQCLHVWHLFWLTLANAYIVTSHWMLVRELGGVTQGSRNLV